MNDERYNYYSKYIENMESMNIIDNNISSCFYSKGIDRLLSLKNVIEKNVITYNKCDYNIVWFRHLPYKKKILIIAMCVIIFQVFSDANHRTAYYIIERNIPGYDIEKFKYYVISNLGHIDYNTIEWYKEILVLDKHLKYLI
jgi:hypothetical protein